MKIFKIILGAIIIALGLGMAIAGWAVAVHGQFTAIANIFLGFTLSFMGMGLSLAGFMLVRGSTVRDALGGIITARSGHSGVGFHYSSDTDQAPRVYTGKLDRIKDILSQIFLYTVIAICVVLLAIFSVFRVTGGLPGLK